MFTFRAMNTDVTVVLPTLEDGQDHADAVAHTFAAAERRFSRFDVDSELTALNRARGPVVVSAPLFDALMRARAYVELTDGAFDPAVGGALAAHGYDRSFAPGALDRDGGIALPRAGRFLDVELHPGTRTVLRPAHLQIDLGGMIKGTTVDAAAALLPTPSVVDAGGDAMLRGRDWPLDIEDPHDARRTLLTLVVSDRAVATSAANRRRWRVAGDMAHHLIDPRTQAPASSDLVQVTVLARTTELADVLAKAAFVLGADAARRLLERQPDVGAVLVRRTGPPLVLGEHELESDHDTRIPA
jgi:thiamine biosynthesis lipoprotein